MNEFAEALGALIFLALIVIIALLLITLPLAFLGWIVLLAINIVGGTVVITYLNSFIIGFVLSLIFNLFSN